MGSTLRLGAAPGHPGKRSARRGPQSRTGGSRGRDRLNLLRGRLAALDGMTRYKDLAALALIAAVTFAVGVVNGAFTGFPKGYDAYGHMSKIKLLVDYFPNVDWNHEWYSGELYSQGSFPPLFHYMGVALVAFLVVSKANALIDYSAASFVVDGWGLFGYTLA